MLQTFLTRRALKEKLDTQRALQGHLGQSGTKGTWRVLMHLDTQGTWTLDHSGTCTSALVGHLGTQALDHLDTWGTLFSRLMFTHPIQISFCLCGEFLLSQWHWIKWMMMLFSVYCTLASDRKIYSSGSFFHLQLTNLENPNVQ